MNERTRCVCNSDEVSEPPVRRQREESSLTAAIAAADDNDSNTLEAVLGHNHMTEGINDGGIAPSPRVAAAVATSGAPGDDDAPAVAVTTTPTHHGDTKQSFDGIVAKQPKSSISTINSNNNDDSSDVPSRSLYLGGIRAEQTSYYDLCRLANYFGPLESVKIIPQRSCAFVNFIDIDAARGFYNKNLETPLQLGTTQLKVGWGRPAPLSPEVATAIANGASRALYMTNIGPSAANETSILAILRAYGDVENILVQTDHRTAFINMTDINNAMKAQQQLDGSNVGSSTVRVGYGKEGQLTRAPSFLRQQPPPSTPATPPMAPIQAPSPSSSSSSSTYAHPSASYPLAPNASVTGPTSSHVQLLPNPPHARGAPSSSSSSAAAQQANGSLTMLPDGAGRGLYLGNVQMEVTAHDLCKLANRYGSLDCLKLMRDKMCAFVNFIEPESAANMFHDLQKRPPTIAGVQLKCGWARGSRSLPPDIATLIRFGATRTLFISGLIQASEEDLNDAFKTFGEVDCIITQADKGTALVSLISLRDAATARNAINGQILGGGPVTVEFTREGTLVVPEAPDILPTPYLPSSLPMSSVRGSSLSHANNHGGHHHSSITGAPLSHPPLLSSHSSSSSSTMPPSPSSAALSASIYQQNTPYDDMSSSAYDTNTDSYDDALQYPDLPQHDPPSVSAPLLPSPSTAAPPPRRMVVTMPNRSSSSNNAPLLSSSSSISPFVPSSLSPSSSVSSSVSDQPSRALFITGVPHDCTYHEICAIANRYGCIENVRIVTPVTAGQSYILLHFYSTEEALRMWQTGKTGKPLTIRGGALRIQWGKAPILGPDVADLLRQGATRNLFVGGVNEDVSEDQIRDLFGPFCNGEFDQVNIMRAKKIAFVHMPSLRAAVSARNALDNQTFGTWRLKVNFAREVGHGGTPHQPASANANNNNGGRAGVRQGSNGHGNGSHGGHSGHGHGGNTMSPMGRRVRPPGSGPPSSAGGHAHAHHHGQPPSHHAPVAAREWA